MIRRDSGMELVEADFGTRRREDRRQNRGSILMELPSDSHPDEFESRRATLCMFDLESKFKNHYFFQLRKTYCCVGVRVSSSSSESPPILKWISLSEEADDILCRLLNTSSVIESQELSRINRDLDSWWFMISLAALVVIGVGRTVGTWDILWIEGVSSFLWKELLNLWL